MRLTISEVKVVTRDDLYKAIDYFSLEAGEADRRIREATGISQEERARKLLEMEQVTKIAIAAMYQIINIMDAEEERRGEKRQRGRFCRGTSPAKGPRTGQEG